MRRGAHDAVRNKTAPLTGWSVVQGTGYVLGVGLLSAVSKDMLHQQYLLNHSKDHNNVQTWNNLKLKTHEVTETVVDKRAGNTFVFFRFVWWSFAASAVDTHRVTHTEWHTPSRGGWSEAAAERKQRYSLCFPSEAQLLRGQLISVHSRTPLLAGLWLTHLRGCSLQSQWAEPHLAQPHTPTSTSSDARSTPWVVFRPTTSTLVGCRGGSFRSG